MIMHQVNKFKKKRSLSQYLKSLNTNEIDVVEVSKQTKIPVEIIIKTCRLQGYDCMVEQN